MKTSLIVSVLALAACAAPSTEPDWGRPLPPGADALLPLGPDDRAPHIASAWIERDTIRPALERSIHWTQTDYARQFFPIAGVDHGRALSSLERFAELLDGSSNAAAFEEAIRREFRWYKSAGWDGHGGGVLFTAYFTPILDGRLAPDAEYRYPLYALPPDLEKGLNGVILGQRTPAGIRGYPTRRAIEAGSLLVAQGLELAWLRDPLDAYIAHVNGSAILKLADGSEHRLGYAGKNGRPYTSLGGELIDDGHVDRDDMSLHAIRAWARENPDLVAEYLSRNDSYVFFTPIDGNPRGSLNVEVEPYRTLATDKTLFPRGAITFVDTDLPLSTEDSAPFLQLMLDQDTGGAIRTAGRADIYLGVGPGAEDRAGRTRSPGQLYYLFLRD